MKTFLAEI